MNNSVSDRSFYIESEEEDDEEKDFNKSIEDGGNTDSSAESFTENRQPNNPSSYNTQWPQSYRQSIDLYSSVPSPGIGFLGTPSLSRLGSSYLSSSLTRRQTPETLPFLPKPLPTLADKEQQQQPQRRSSHSLLPPLPRRTSVRKDEKASRVTHDQHPMARQSSFTQAVFNGINVLCGVGILSTPYAVKEGGWLGLLVLLIFAVLSFYTGLLLRYCLDSQPGLETYPDIGQAAFGIGGRIAISIVLYVELYACCIEYIILESDNLSSLFPNAQLSLGGFVLDAHLLFAIATTLAVLPTVWLRDLSVLSYISAGGVIASILVVLCLLWVGLVDGVGFESKGTPLNLATLPVAMGLYGYCYSGHAVFPNIYTSLENRSQYPAILLTCFCICTLMYGGVAVMGYTMFGELTQSQFTLNMPHDLVATKIALWTTVVNPFTKYPLLQIMQIMNVILCTNTNIYHTSAHNACNLEFYFVFGKTSERTVTRTTYAQTKMVAELDGHVMRCVRDQNGNHVVQKCIECVPEDAIQFVVSTFYDQVVTLSTHPYGCRVIQRVLEHCHDPKTQQIMMDEILQSVCILAQDQYGNYVVQHVLEHGKPHERSCIIKELTGQIVQMSQQKFASNVIEKCLSFGTLAERQALVTEMLGTTDENEPLQAMMKDQFANYVVQKVLETCDDQQLELILNRIKVHLNALKKYTYGKHIVARVEKLVAAGERRISILAPQASAS